MTFTERGNIFMLRGSENGQKVDVKRVISSSGNPGVCQPRQVQPDFPRLIPGGTHPATLGTLEGRVACSCRAGRCTLQEAQGRNPQRGACRMSNLFTNHKLISSARITGFLRASRCTHEHGNVKPESRGDRHNIFTGNDDNNSGLADDVRP